MTANYRRVFAGCRDKVRCSTLRASRPPPCILASRAVSGTGRATTGTTVPFVARPVPAFCPRLLLFQQHDRCPVAVRPCVGRGPKPGQAPSAIRGPASPPFVLCRIDDKAKKGFPQEAKGGDHCRRTGANACPPGSGRLPAAGQRLVDRDQRGGCIGLGQRQAVAGG